MKKLIAVLLFVSIAMTSSMLYAPAAHADSYIQPLGIEVKKASNSGAQVLDVYNDSLFREPDTDIGNGFVTKGAMIIEPGDIIIGINDIEVITAHTIMDAWPNCRIDSDVEFRFIHNGREASATIKKSKADAGVALGNSSYGVTVVGVSSPAASEAGIQEGDLIVGVNEETVKAPEDLMDILNRCSMKEEVRVDYVHEGQFSVTMVPLQDYDFRICELKNGAYGIKAGDSTELITIKAIGDLSLKRSFHWLWRNSDKDKWQEIINDSDAALKMGIRIENSLDGDTGLYTSTLWADNIKKSATGSFYLMITDKGGMTVLTGEMTLKVK